MKPSTEKQSMLILLQVQKEHLFYYPTKTDPLYKKCKTELIFFAVSSGRISLSFFL
jgi:hypothetical protein